MSDPGPARVRELFEAARHLSGTERAAYLDRTCAGDTSLRREVLDLLAHYNEIAPTFHTESPASRDTRRDHEHLPPGTVVGHYTIERVLGEGGMGAVYLAHQERPARPVALKLIRRGWASERTLKRFSRETELLGRLQHPGIAQIYDAGIAETPHGTQPFFAMEFVKGRSLLLYANDAALDTRARLALLSRICDAAHHAHQSGIIHRDLKPANILVTEDAHPKILDFGVARATDADLQITTVHTDVGQLIGTVPYMSPEQATGDPGAIDARSDVYALGVVAYQLLTGRLPYDLSGKMIHEAVRIIHDDDPTPLSSLDRSLRGDIETIVAKALEKERHRRYQSAAELAADIDRHLADKPIGARPPSTIYQLRKFARRNKALVAGVAATFLVLLVGIGATSWQAVRATRAKVSAQAAVAEATAISNFLTDMLQQANPWQVPGRITVEEAVLKAADLIEQRFQGQPAVELSVRRAIGDTLHAIGLYDQSIAQYDTALELAGATLAPDDPEVLDLRISRAKSILGAGRIDDAEQTFDTILRDTEALPPDHPQRLRAKLGLADTLNLRNTDPDRAIGLHIEVADAYERSLGPDAPETLTAKSSLASTYLYFQRIDDAKALSEDLLEQHLRIFGPNHSKTIVIRSGLAEANSLKGEWDAAEALYRTNAEISTEAFGPQHPDTAEAISGLANVLQSTGRAEEAEPYFLQAFEICRAKLGDEHPRTQACINNHAGCLSRLGRHEEALTLHKANLEVRRRVLGDDHPNTAQSLAFIGTTLMRAGRNDEAEPYLEESIRIYSSAYDYQDAPDIIDNTMNLGVAHLRQGEFEQAVPYLRAVVESERRTLATDHPWIAIDGARLASALHGAGQYDQAIVEWDEAIRINTKNQPENTAKLAELSSRRAATLVHLSRFAEAEPIMVAAHDVLAANEATIPWRDENIQRLVALYTAWDAAEPNAGHDAQAALWHARLPAAPVGARRE